MDEYKLEQFLWKNPDFIEEGLKVIDRQRRVETGHIDLLCKDKNGNHVIVEIKIDPSHDSVSQIAKYIIGLMKEGIPREQIRGMLAARYIDKDLQELCAFFNIEAKELAIGKKDQYKKTIDKTTHNIKENTGYTNLTKQGEQKGNLPPITDPSKHLSWAEITVVKTILTFNKNNQYATYPDISKSMKITKSCIRSYVSSIITKGIPIYKKRLKNNKILLYLKEENKPNFES